MLDPRKAAMLEWYNQGMAHYKSRAFGEALACFRKAQETLPGDGPSELYVERCETYLHNPPPADWDGVYVMTTK
jgi:hypothetical protein